MYSCYSNCILCKVKCFIIIWFWLHPATPYHPLFFNCLLFPYCPLGSFNPISIFYAPPTRQARGQCSRTVKARIYMLIFKTNCGSPIRRLMHFFPPVSTPRPVTKVFWMDRLAFKSVGVMSRNLHNKTSSHHFHSGEQMIFSGQAFSWQQVCHTPFSHLCCI